MEERDGNYGLQMKLMLLNVRSLGGAMRRQVVKRKVRRQKVQIAL